MATPSVSVIVPAYNVEDNIARQLDALGREIASFDGEIIVVDDNSRDATAQRVMAWAVGNPNVPLTLLRARRRRGICGSRNAGLAAAASPIVAFADGDDVVDIDWMSGLIAVHKAGHICGGAVRGQDSMTRLPERFGVPYSFGGCMLMDRSLAIGLAGFDEQIRRGGTEIDFAIRAQLMAGAVVVNTLEAVTLYHEPDSFGLLARRGFQRERGHAYVRQRYRSEIDFGSARKLPWRSVAGNLVRLVASRDRRASSRVLDLLRSVWQLLWDLRFRVHMPVQKLYVEGILQHYACWKPRSVAGREK